jgi:hypothetical protein
VKTRNGEVVRSIATNWGMNPTNPWPCEAAAVSMTVPKTKCGHSLVTCHTDKCFKVWYPPPRSVRTRHRVAQGDRAPVSTRDLPWPFKVFEHIDRLHAWCMRFVPEDQWDGLER